MTEKSEALEIFGTRVRRRREALGLIQKDIATLSRIAVSNYGKIERGLTNVTLTSMLRIAVALDVDLAELMAGMGAETPPASLPAFSAAEFIAARNQAMRSKA